VTYADVQRAWYFRDAWRCLSGASPGLQEGGMPGPVELMATEWDETFERAMRARLVQGAFRYGRVVAGGAGKARYDRVGRAERELEMYREDGRAERLIDVANMMLLEFVEGGHAGRRLDASGDEGVKTREVI